MLENRPKEDEPEGHSPGSRTPAQGTPANLNLNRLYIFEGTPSLTGSVADHRFRVKTSEVAAVASALAGRWERAVPLAAVPFRRASREP